MKTLTIHKRWVYSIKWKILVLSFLILASIILIYKKNTYYVFSTEYSVFSKAYDKQQFFPSIESSILNSKNLNLLALLSDEKGFKILSKKLARAATPGILRRFCWITAETSEEGIYRLNLFIKSETFEQAKFINAFFTYNLEKNLKNLPKTTFEKKAQNSSLVKKTFWSIAIPILLLSFGYLVLFEFIKKDKYKISSKLRILYISRARVPSESANSQQIMKTCEALAKQGAEVTLLVPLSNLKKFKGVDPYKHYDTEKIFRIKRLFAPDMTFLYKDESLFSGVFKRMELFFISIAILFNLLKTSANIVYSRNPFFCFLTSWFKVTCYECHGQVDSRLLNLFDRKISKRCLFSVYISEPIREYLIKCGFQEKNIYKIYSGVPDNFFESEMTSEIFNIKKYFDLPQNKKVVLYTGQLYESKGVYELANAAKYIDGSVVIVGGNETAINDLRFYIKKNNLKNVFITGFFEIAMIPKFLRNADVLVLPSIQNSFLNQFTSPLKMFQYMTSKKPIVSTALPGIKEFLNEANAVLVKPDSSEDLARGINFLLNNEKQGQLLALKAYECVAQYTYKARAEKIINIINQRIVGFNV